MKERPILALIYDFDNTLATTDMQNFSFIKRLGMKPSEFWDLTDEMFKKYDMDKILCYLFMMVKVCKEKKIKLTREFLQSCGKDITYFEGLPDWFDRINKLGEDYNVTIEHYVISSGNLEIVEGSFLNKYFTKVFASEFIYDDNGEAVWPKTAINYTLKTQYIYRINKGLISDNDDVSINAKQKEKRVPMTNMIYIGDGLTDVPAMLTVKNDGGTAIAVYAKGKRHKVNKYYEDDRVNYICEANYSKNSPLERIVKLIIKSTAIKRDLHEQELKSIDE